MAYYNRAILKKNNLKDESWRLDQKLSNELDPNPENRFSGM